MSHTGPSLRRGNWRCPKCESTVIVEVSRGGVVHTRVEGLDERGDVVYGPHTHVESGDADRYECAACAEPVRDGPVIVAGRTHLAGLLKRHGA